MGPCLPRPRPLAVGLALALVVSACGSASPTPASIPAGSGPQATWSAIPGNAVVAPLPTDAPPAVVARPPLPSCGAEVLFEQDVDITPIPTPPGPTSAPADNAQAAACLQNAWDNGKPAELATSETSDEADEIYTIYSLPGDATVVVTTRVWSHTEKSATWSRSVCRQLSIQEGRVTPADCTAEQPLGSPSAT
jgi:hypothetical protein